MYSNKDDCSASDIRAQKLFTFFGSSLMPTIQSLLSQSSSSSDSPDLEEVDGSSHLPGSGRPGDRNSSGSIFASAEAILAQFFSTPATSVDSSSSQPQLCESSARALINGQSGEIELKAYSEDDEECESHSPDGEEEVEEDIVSCGDHLLHLNDSLAMSSSQSSDTELSIDTSSGQTANLVKFTATTISGSRSPNHIRSYQADRAQQLTQCSKKESLLAAALTPIVHLQRVHERHAKESVSGLIPTFPKVYLPIFASPYFGIFSFSYQLSLLLFKHFYSYIFIHMYVLLIPSYYAGMSEPPRR
ncbi:unnamed protein product [Protopolystoma xenopodis]|uniref:Uncharacterized protein n=1 Tax=Protopolystoma xenopodis TaxID=117903 RepID=A0A448XMF7_9PLAT|nr:unnamed protein product [Protopolystoma xenopodis]